MKAKKKGGMLLIGGAAISRGITLEGLSVSYFLRIAKTPVRHINTNGTLVWLSSGL